MNPDAPFSLSWLGDPARPQPTQAKFQMAWGTSNSGPIELKFCMASLFGVIVMKMTPAREFEMFT